MMRKNMKDGTDTVSQQAVVTCAIPKSLQDLSVEFRTAFKKNIKRQVYHSFFCSLQYEIRETPSFSI